jgi:His-Xaa-Ser repeat protein HxsA
MRRVFVIPSLLAAGFAPLKEVPATVPHEDDAGQNRASLFDLFRLQHRYTLAAHRSHSSHSSHRSHRSSSGGGYFVPRQSPPAPSRNFDSTPPSTILPSPPSVAPKTLPGNSGKFTAIVRQVQMGLYAYGYYTGAIDGIAGPGTKAALAKFQGDYGLKVTGTVTPEVLDALGIVAQ